VLDPRNIFEDEAACRVETALHGGFGFASEFSNFAVVEPVFDIV
jgi:hypothetical protein